VFAMTLAADAIYFQEDCRRHDLAKTRSPWFCRRRGPAAAAFHNDVLAASWPARRRGFAL